MITTEFKQEEVNYDFLVDCMQEYLVMDPKDPEYDNYTKFMYSITAVWIVKGLKKITQPEL